MSLKTYILLSNIKIKPGIACYLKNPHYFIKKLGGAENIKSYKFLHNKDYLTKFCIFFGVVEHKKKIRDLIAKKAEDNEILNEILDDLKPGYPNFDKIIKKLKISKKIPVYGPADFILENPATNSVTNNCIIVGDNAKNLPEKGAIYNMGFYCDTMEDINFLHFLDFILGKIGHKPVMFRNYFTRNDRVWENLYMDTSVKKNPLNIQVWVLHPVK